MDAKVVDFQQRTAIRKRRIEQTKKSQLAEEERKKRLREEKESRGRQEEESIRRLERRLEDERNQKDLELQQKLEEEAKEQKEAGCQRELREEEGRKRAEEDRIRQTNEDMKRLKLAKQQLTAHDNELPLKIEQITDKLETAKSNEYKLGSKVDSMSSRIVSRQVLENDEKQIKFYTGLP